MNFEMNFIQHKIHLTKAEKMEKIYILRKNKLISGPHSIETVKERGLRYTDMVWYEGLTDWTPADQIEIFKENLKDSSRIHRSIFDKFFGFLK